MRRREFIALLGGAAVAWPLAAGAQQPALPVIGFMSGRAPEDSSYLVDAFRQGLIQSGFVEGRNVAVEFRWAYGDYDRLPALAAELVGRNVAVLVGVGGDNSAVAAKRATSTIPIVFGMGGDPIKAGLVESLNRPGGNATGFTLLTNQLEPKRVGLMHELVPTASLLGALLNPGFLPAADQLRDVEEAARAVNLRLFVAKANNDQELSAAFESLAQQRVRCRAGDGKSVLRHPTRANYFARGTEKASGLLSLSRIRYCGRPHQLRSAHNRRLSASRHLCRPNSQRRQTR